MWLIVFFAHLLRIEKLNYTSYSFITGTSCIVTLKTRLSLILVHLTLSTRILQNKHVEFPLKRKRLQKKPIYLSTSSSKRFYCCV